MAELRRLQTERFLRSDLDQAEGLVSQKEVARAQLLARRVNGLHTFETILHQADEQVAAMVNARNTNQSQSDLIGVHPCSSVANEPFPQPRCYPENSESSTH
jgi:hypothetical protein